MADGNRRRRTARLGAMPRDQQTAPARLEQRPAAPTMTRAPASASQPERLPEMIATAPAAPTRATAVSRAHACAKPSPPMATAVMSICTVSTTLGLPQVMPRWRGRKGGRRNSPTRPHHSIHSMHRPDDVGAADDERDGGHGAADAGSRA